MEMVGRVIQGSTEGLMMAVAKAPERQQGWSWGGRDRLPGLGGGVVMRTASGLPVYQDLSVLQMQKIRSHKHNSQEVCTKQRPVSHFAKPGGVRGGSLPTVLFSRPCPMPGAVETRDHSASSLQHPHKVLKPLSPE